MERFENKIGSAGGMSMYPAPTELPMAAAIAPDLYSQSPEATIILDNLNVLETLVADIMAYPNLDNRAELIDAAVARFTDNESGQRSARGVPVCSLCVVASTIRAALPLASSPSLSAIVHVRQ